MTDYILNSFMCPSIWTLNNAEWLNGEGGWGSFLKIYSNGSAEREVANIYNKNWELKVYGCIAPPLGVSTGMDIQIFLQDDANPIIFRKYINMTEFKRYFYIIYDGIIRAQISDDSWIDFCELYSYPKIWRIGSIYYYGPIHELSFDYGSIKKLVKLKLATFEGITYTKWHHPDWYYTEPLGDVYIF